MKAPIEMPTMYVAQQVFEPQRIDYMAPEASGRINGVQAGFPLWQGTWQLGMMPEEYSDEWRAFFRGIRGQLRRFIGRDLAKQLPRAYRDTGAMPGGFDGQASSWSESINADGDSELTLNGLPASFVLSQGDMIDFRYTATEDSVSGLPWRALVSVVEGATANGSGTVTVTVEPPVPSVVPGGATAHVSDTGCIMVQILDQSTVGPVDRLYSIREGTLSAIQDLRA